MENLPQRAHINIDDHTVTRIETDDTSIRFYLKHVKVGKTLSSHDWMGFEIEKKLYTNSNHCSKISFWAPEGEEKKKKKQVEAFIDELMSDVTPIARFSLEKYTDTSTSN